MKIEITDDKLKAYLILDENETNNPSTHAQLAAQLTEKSITHGLKSENWGAYIDEFKQSLEDEAKLLVAEGQSPQAGKDAWLEYFFTPDPQKTVVMDNDGKIDFHHLDFVQNVSKGAKLVELHDPEPGVPGKNIFGEVIEVEDGKPIELPHSQNAIISTENPKILIAKIDGHVRLSRNKEVIVEDILTISGDIDFSTGNIETNGSVIINGDVKSGFEVKATGDITIKGIVEDAKIISDANVIVKKGFTGHGKGLIKSAGDVSTSHVNNQQIVADGNIFVNGEAIQGHLIAGEAVETRGQAGNIIGGITIAGTYVHAQNLGNANTTRTDITIGADTQIHQVIKKQQETIDDTKSRLAKVKQGVAALVRVQLKLGKLPADKTKILEELKKARLSLDAQLADQEILLEELQNEAESLGEKAEVKVRDTIFPGVRLHYHSHNFPVKSMIKKETITPENFYEFLERQER